MTGYSKHGALVQMVVIDCLQRGLDHYIDAKEQILEEHNKSREDGRISSSTWRHGWRVARHQATNRGQVQPHKGIG